MAAPTPVIRAAEHEQVADGVGGGAAGQLRGLADT
jgi:hypothetical protein